MDGSNHFIIVNASDEGFIKLRLVCRKQMTNKKKYNGEGMLVFSMLRLTAKANLIGIPFIFDFILRII